MMAMKYVYQFEIHKSEKYYIANCDQLGLSTFGVDFKDAAESAFDILEMKVQDALMHKYKLPEAVFAEQAPEGAQLLAVAIDTSLDDVKRVTASEAARRLGVSPARVSQLIKSGRLESFKDAGTVWVTVDSVNARLSDSPRAGRPAKVLATA